MGAEQQGASIGVIATIDRVLLEQRGHLFAWSPVCLAGGIGWYFLLRSEPGWQVYSVTLGAGAISVVAALRWPEG